MKVTGIQNMIQWCQRDVGESEWKFLIISRFERGREGVQLTPMKIWLISKIMWNVKEKNVKICETEFQDYGDSCQATEENLLDIKNYVKCEKTNRKYECEWKYVNLSVLREWKWNICEKN